MKKKLNISLLMFVVSALLTAASAQTQLPVDPAWRMGTLPNGMKYYIRYNAKPEGKAGFWIIHDIGALHETHNQNGLAHFLEHMAFNGLKHFPDKTMLEYMQSIGCAFGANINASTSQQLTQYLLTDVPLLREGIIDTCLLILHDWSGHILCEQEELDAERGVIREEWRTGRSAIRRNYQERNKTLYAGTPYATRTVIGDTSIINNFTQKEILDFYHDWYRPNMQAVVIVGDFDVDKMETKVKTIFSTLKNPENMKTKAEFNIHDNVEPITQVYKDPELTTNSVHLYIKFPAKFNKTNRNSEEFLRYELLNDYIATMLTSRLNEAQQQPNAKFLNTFIGINDFAGDRDAFFLMVSTKNNELSEGFDQALTIAEQARRFGFTENELERAKANLMQRYENSLSERNNKRHNEFNRLAYRHFQHGYPLLSEEDRVILTKKFNNNINVSELNEIFQKTMVLGPNTIIYASGPDKDDVTLPDDEMLRIIMYGAEKKQLSPYIDVETDKPLISKNIKSGKVTKETKNESLETIEWTLNNGAKVILKPTPFKQDEILLTGFSFGGFSVLSDADWAATRNIMGMIDGYNSGVSEFGRATLRKMFAGKRVGVVPSINDLTQNIDGYCSPKDFEILLQLVHLYFTQPRFEQDEFDISKGRLANSLKNKSADPAITLNDTLNNLLNNHHYRAKSLSEEDLDKLNLNKIRDVYQQRFANPGAFTFIFIGNIDPKVAKPLIEKYIGGLSGNKKENYNDLNMYPVKGDVKLHFQRPLHVEKASVNIIFTGDMSKTPENAMALNYLQRILRLRYTDEIREKRGGTYGTSVRSNFHTIPKERYTLTISFDTDPKLKDELIEVVFEELHKIAENGPPIEDFNNSQTNMKSQYDQNIKENGYWNSVLQNYYQTGKDSYSTWLNAFEITDAKKIQEFAKEVLKQNNRIEVVMLPE